MPDRVEVTVLRNGGKDYVEVPTQEEGFIAALLSDRAGYIRDGHLHLIPGVDKTLEFYGYEGPLEPYGDDTQDKPKTAKKGQ